MRVDEGRGRENGLEGRNEELTVTCRGWMALMV